MNVIVGVLLFVVLNISGGMAGAGDLFIANDTETIQRMNMEYFVGNLGNERVGLAMDECGRSGFHVSLTEGQVGSSGGFSKQQKLPESVVGKKLYLTFTVKFDQDFLFSEINETGKLLGLTGGNPSTNTGGQDIFYLDDDRGWSVRINWRGNGELGVYIYHMNQPTDYGEDFCLNLKKTKIIPGMTYTITLLVGMNSVGTKDGVLKVWVDNVLCAAYDDIEYRSARENSGDIERIALSTFIGGKEDYAHAKQEGITISNVVLSKTLIGTYYPESVLSILLWEMFARLLVMPR